MNVRLRCLICFVLPLPLLLLSGCLWSKRKLPVPKQPTATISVTPDVLVNQLNERWNSFDTLTATVDIQASVIASRKGVATDYTVTRGHILMRKPEMLRVLGQKLGIRMFDMASDGKTFTLFIPHLNKAIKGPNQLNKKSTNALENMRPGFFFDAMMVRSLDKEDLYSVTADDETVEDRSKKRLYFVPEYVLNIMRHKVGTQQLIPERVVTFHREDLLPYQQDLYDENGVLETQVKYAEYKDFGTSKFPSLIVIRRPKEEYEITLTVEDVKVNQPLTDDQFAIKIPDGTQIKQLE